MSDMKLFHVGNSDVRELYGSSVTVERRLQTLFEQHLETLLGVRFLASEYSTGPVHGGRIDTLGIDENGGPVIIEYKRARDENVTSQGLFYLTWLLDHRAEFELLVQKRKGREVADAIVWSAPRVLCIASDFTRFDIHAVQQMGRNIELIRYRLYGDDHLVLEMVYSGTLQATREPAAERSNGSAGTKSRVKAAQKAISEILEQSPPDLKERYEALKTFLLSLGEDVQISPTAVYIGFRRIRNFACVAVHATLKDIVIWLKLDPTTVTLEEGFTRDVRNIGHHGMGDLEIVLRTETDLARAEPLLLRAYEAS